MKRIVILDSVILDKDVKVEAGTHISGTSSFTVRHSKRDKTRSVDEFVKVLFAVSECGPFAKSGGLADVAGSLPKELKSLGTDVRVILPKYGTISDEFKTKMKKVRNLRCLSAGEINIAGLKSLPIRV